MIIPLHQSIGIWHLLVTWYWSRAHVAVSMAPFQ